MGIFNDSNQKLKEAVDNYLYARGNDDTDDKKVIELADNMLVEALDYIGVMNNELHSIARTVEEQREILKRFNG